MLYQDVFECFDIFSIIDESVHFLLKGCSFIVHYLFFIQKFCSGSVKEKELIS